MTATTLGTLLFDRAECSPDGLALVVGEREVTFAQLAEETRAIARGLVARGIGRGSRVAVLMPNSVEFAATFFAVDLVGAVLVTVNARYRSQELRYLLHHCRPDLLLTTDEIAQWTDYVDLIVEAAPGFAAQSDPRHLEIADLPWLRTVVLAGRGGRSPALDLSDFVADGATVGDLTPIVDDGERTGVLLYTSGTTSAPKACEIRGRALVHNWRHWTDVIGLDEGDAVWAPCPFFHIAGIGPLVGTVAAGATLLTAMHFDADATVEQIRRYRPAHLFAGFPALILGVLQADGYDRDAFGFVRTAHCVAPGGVQQSIQDLLPAGGVLTSNFGMTEGAGPITYTPLSAPEAVRVRSTGPAFGGYEVRIANGDEVCAVEEPGEIQFRSESAFHGYLDDPQATAETIDPEGWVHSGDLGVMDADGNLDYLGRIKDQLKVGGENVAPLEIESLLAEHPAVNIAQVVGRADARLGEVPVAFVELLPGRTAVEAELIEFVHGKVASFKVPRSVLFVTDWPMSTTKILKSELRKMA